MSSARVPASSLSASQQPRILTVPECSSSLGQEAVELAASAGLFLDPWQQLVLEHALGLRADGKWAAFEVGLTVPRQNGKGSLLEARELAGLFLAGERLIIHSAHQFDTSLEAFRRLLTLIEEHPDFDRRVKRVSRAHGEEGIELKNRQRIRFRTRTKGGGRGFTSDCLILPESAHGALLPTLSARPNPQVWYAGSAVDQTIHEDGIVFARVRARGLRGDPSLAYCEWSLDYPNPADVPDDVLNDPEAWARANPGLGIRITAEHVENERRAMDPRTFAVEREGVGDWPSLDDSGAVIGLEEWLRLTDGRSRPVDPICFAFDIPPDRSSAAIAVAGRRSDGDPHVEVIAHARGTGWIVSQLAELVAKHKPIATVCDQAGQGAALLHELEDAGVTVTSLSARDHANGCGLFFDAVEQGKLHHLGQPELSAAIKGAVKRPLGDSWAWSRKSSGTDISPLVACTLALWGVSSSPAYKEPIVLWR